jgi:hypothetical protein
MSIEKRIFDWKDWDQLDTWSLLFTDCVMVKDFGPLRKGETYNTIVVNFEKGCMEVWTDEHIVHKLDVELSVV